MKLWDQLGSLTAKLRWDVGKCHNDSMMGLINAWILLVQTLKFMEQTLDATILFQVGKNGCCLLKSSCSI